MDNPRTLAIFPEAILAFLCALSMNAGSAQSVEKRRLNSIRTTQTPAGLPRYALLNINNLTTWMRADGLSNHSPTGDNGTYFPRRTSFVIYQDGILWGGKAYADSAKTQPAPFGQLIRVGGATYVTGCREGWINGFGAGAERADPDDPRVRIYRIRRDYSFMSAKELRQDAAETNEIALSDVTPAQEEAVKDQYAKDWTEWPVELGAPYIDRNHNGNYDPPPAFISALTPDNLIEEQYDEPGMAGVTPETPADQVIWTVYNDLDRDQTQKLYGSEPLGLEVQVTLWAFKSNIPWGSYFLRRVRIINKGGVDLDHLGTRGAFWIDNMYVGQWSDPDVGEYSDDLVGCDTLVSLGYVYNSKGPDAEFHKFKLPPPAAGYSIVQGPRVPARNDSAMFDFKRIFGWKNLPMTSFTYLAFGIAYSDQWALRYYRMLRGFAPVSVDVYYPFPPGMTPNQFPLSGDPVRGTGFIDGLGTTYSLVPGDRRLMVSCGPFNLAPGDSQEVVIGFIAGLGADHLSSITVAKHIARQVRLWFPYQPYFDRDRSEPAPEPVLANYFTLSQNYPNPLRLSAADAPTRIDYTIPKDVDVRLAIYDLLGREVVVLERGRKKAGFFSAFWDGRDQSGREIPTGIYFCRLQAGYVHIMRKLAVIR